MQGLRDHEVGVLFWATSDPRTMLNKASVLGVKCAQLGVAGDLDLSCTPAWVKALTEAQFPVTAVSAAYRGEDYADIPTVERTVGFIPLGTRQEREKRTYEVADFAHAIGAEGIATHIGFVPHDKSDPNYQAMLEMVRRVCDHAAKHELKFALETGQESAPVLLAFLRDVNRRNLGINFDPANMILYGTGDPIEALGVLKDHVISVHCKDGSWPPKEKPEALGKECALGAGAVGLERFVAKLEEIGYTGPLTIEREGVEPAQWDDDVKNGIALLERIKAHSAGA
jgi:sugar phosphate isomerase/epimerase